MYACIYVSSHTRKRKRIYIYIYIYIYRCMHAYTNSGISTNLFNKYRYYI